jgi:hypothetical protein
MANVHEISDQVAAFLANRLSLEKLEDWSAEYSWNIHERADERTKALAYRVRAILNAYSDDADESSLREELATAILPFARSAMASARTIEVVFGGPSVSATSANRAYPIRPERAIA